MLLQQIAPAEFKGFPEGEGLTVEPDLTVLSGANDVGKSALLRLIALLCRDKQVGKAEQSDFNRAYLAKVASSWETDDRFGCMARFTLTDSSTKYVPPDLAQLGVTTIQVRALLAPRRHTAQIEAFQLPEGKWKHRQHGLTALPKTVCLPRSPDDPVRDEIRLDQPIRLPERELLSIGFPDFNPSGLTSLPYHSFVAALDTATERINRGLSRLLPPTHQLRLLLSPSRRDDSRVIHVHVREGGGVLTPLSERGAGLQRLARILGVLLAAEAAGESTIILWDEPEQSLHPGAQRHLRRLLTEISQKPTIQTVIATHSPVMIPAMAPRAVRRIVVAREQGGDSGVTATVSKIENRPYGDGLRSLAVDLGMALSDSFFLAPITLVVEGPTEVNCLGGVLRLLAESRPEIATALDELETYFTCWDAGGSDWVRATKYVHNKQCLPIVLLDGDKTKELVKAREEWEPLRDEVPVVVFPNGKEFEDVFPLDRYFSALQESLAEQAVTQPAPAFVSQEDFEEFSRTTAGKWSEFGELVVSSKLSLYLKSKGLRYDKVGVAKIALKKLEPGELREVDTIQEVVTALKRARKRL